MLYATRFYCFKKLNRVKKKNLSMHIQLIFGNIDFKILGFKASIALIIAFKEFIIGSNFASINAHHEQGYICP